MFSITPGKNSSGCSKNGFWLVIFKRYITTLQSGEKFIKLSGVEYWQTGPQVFSMTSGNSSSARGCSKNDLRQILTIFLGCLNQRRRYSLAMNEEI